MTDEATLVLSAEEYQFWTIDHVRQQITIVRQDGQTLTEPLEPGTRSEFSQIATSVFDWEKWWISTITRRGDWIIWMGFNAASPDPGPHRPTIYLDQNMWGLVATALTSPERVTKPEELEAALEIARLATDDGVILPLSSAHLVETSALHTERRYEVGMAIARLAGGWQMRHPMNVLQHEAAAVLAAHFDRDNPLWTFALLR